MMAGPSRSARSSSTTACEGALAIGPRDEGAPDGHGRPETAATEAHRAIEAIWRIESAQLIAGLARIVGDIGTAEDLAQDALVAALEQWPAEGVPERPGAWLMGTAKHRAIDLIRRRKMLERKHEEIGRDAERPQEGLELDPAVDEEVGDDLLGLIFMACHPVLAKEARVALTLRVLGGLTTEEIARAFLIPVPAVAQRIVRAKRTLVEAHVRFEIPGGAERLARLASVLEVIYLIFNEGYSATAGDDWVRPALCEEALRLGRILAELAPTEPEVHGLVALMEIQASRLSARVGPSGEPVLLLDQERAHWDRLLIRRGLAALERAERLEGALGPYALQAAIAACHARARTAAETDWPRIVALYDAVAQLAPSPVVELNRAVAVGMAFGPAAGLDIVDALVAEPSLKSYHLLPAVRGDLLRKLGRSEEARVEFEHAASLTDNVRERELLQKRAAECAAELVAG
jgi:RNA polymerase sigma factor (sigma-70 family)